MLHIVGAAAVLAAVIVMLMRPIAKRARRKDEGYLLGALIDDIERAGKLAEVGGMDVLVQRVVLAEDQQAEAAKVRAELGVTAPAVKVRAPTPRREVRAQGGQAQVGQAQVGHTTAEGASAPRH